MLFPLIARTGSGGDARDGVDAVDRRCEAHDKHRGKSLPDRSWARTYFVGMEIIVTREDGKGVPRWIETAFGAMLRNSAHVTD